MTLATLIFGLLCAILIGVLFHLWADGGLGRLVLYLGLSIAGFAAGQLLGDAWGMIFLSVGSLNLGIAAIGSLLFLGLGHWLSLVRVERSGPSRKV